MSSNSALDSIRLRIYSMPHIARHILAIVTAILSLPPSTPAFEMPLTDKAVREAYFLGQRHDQKTAEFLYLYARLLPLPDKGPYVSEIHLLTPCAQVVSVSSRHSTGYSAQQAAADYHGRGDTLLLQVRIEFTATYTHDDAVRSASDAAGEFNRHLDPEDFWRAFTFTLSQPEPHADQGSATRVLEPRDGHSEPIYGSASRSDTTSTLRGAIVFLEYDASQFESLPTRVEVRPPTTAPVAAQFDLAKLR
jgi:hypothetical protein